MRDSLHHWTQELEDIKSNYESTKKKNQQILDRKRESVEKVKRKCPDGGLPSEMDKLLSGKGGERNTCCEESILIFI